MTQTRYEVNAGQLRTLKDRRKPGTCTWCGGSVPKGRRSWCGQACVDEYLIRRSGAALRQAVFRRDRGVCAICRVNCESTERIVRWLHRKFGAYERPKGLPRDQEPYLRTKGPTWWNRTPSTFWEADHIVPVVEGGGACGLENLRTLCWWCHRRVTAELAARRASPATKAKRAFARAQQELTTETCQPSLLRGDRIAAVVKGD